MEWEQYFRSMPRSRPYTTDEFVVEFGADFGAVVRGTQVPGQAAGVVTIPPGRYWLDVFGANIEKFQAWAKSKAGVNGVKIETTQQDVDAASGAGHLFVIFSVPKTANDFNVNGVWWQPTVFGFPTIADATVQSSEDTTQRPDAPTVTDILSEAANSGAKIGKSGFEGLGLPPMSEWPWLKIALIGAGVAFVATLPSTLFKTVAGRVL